MNREIKFRAWDKKEKEWRAIGFHIFGEWSMLEGQYLTKDLKSINNLEITQYTGLKDKNGTEIYEGDVITHSDHPKPYPTGVVEWDKENAEFTVGIGTATETTQFHEVIGNIYENPEYEMQKL